MNKIKVLIVSIAFPPKFDSESLQVERVVKELLKRKQLNVSIVTAGFDLLRNVSVVNGADDFSSKVKFYYEVAVYENRWINKILDVIGLMNIPDAKWTFAIHKEKVLKNIPGSIDIVYSRSFPPSSTLLAKKLTEKLRVPWIMHLSDPWYLNPLNNYSWFEKKMNRLWERRCFEKASLVSFTTEGTLDLYQSYYPEYSYKFFLSYNSVSIDTDKVVNVDEIKSSKLKIVHAGLLNRSRNPKLLIQALRYIQENRPEVFGCLEVVFVGAIDRYIKHLMGLNKDMISYHGVIGYDESKRLIESADVVLAFDNAFTSDAAAVFLPSKLLDYAAARKKIACITNKGSPSCKFVREVGGSVFEHTSLQQLTDFICSSVDRKNKVDRNFFIPEPIPERFTTPKVVDRLVDKIELLTL